MDLEFIGVLQQQCQKYVTEKKIATVQQIQEHIQKLVRRPLMLVFDCMHPGKRRCNIASDYT